MLRSDIRGGPFEQACTFNGEVDDDGFSRRRRNPVRAALGGLIEINHHFHAAAGPGGGP